MIQRSEFPLSVDFSQRPREITQSRSRSVRAEPNVGMAPGRKQCRGCWTCRLRHKRCDLVQPVCRNCQRLEIICYSDEARPSWMDGGVGQKHMSEVIKERIKQNAYLRREMRVRSHEDQETILATRTNRTPYTDAVFKFASNATSHVDDLEVRHIRPASVIATTVTTSFARPTILQSPLDQPAGLQSFLPSDSSNVCPVTLKTISSSNSPWPAGPAVPIQVQLGSIMIYLDHVFPFLFPFYRPSLIETGRQWLLGLLCQNAVSFHVASSLSAYFFSLIPHNGEQGMHDDCKALVLNQLVEHMKMAVASIQDTVSVIRHRESQSPLLDRVRVMEEITQLLIVEATVRRNLDWTIHLTPALALFDEIFKSHGYAHSEPSLAMLLGASPLSFSTPTPHPKPLPYTADQSALVFFVSLLLFVDIVASTSLNISPVLRNYHNSLLSTHSEAACRVWLEDVVGCQSWALVAIGDVSALCEWKRDARQSGTYSVVTLVSLAGLISQALDQGLASLDIGAISSRCDKMSSNQLEGYYNLYVRNIDPVSIADITRIWAYAAKIYLAVSLLGWQPNSVDIQTSVAKILSLLQTIESPAQLRSLSWPICIAGCLAMPSQEHRFRLVFGVMGQLGDFGTMSQALNIMEAVWSSRDTIDENSWDIASSLNLSGAPALLV